MTSFDVVAYLRRLLAIKKVGHCGTLDPYAVGVLPVCLGVSTGATGYLLSMRKSYRVEVVFGFSTDTLDLEGEIVARGNADRLPEEQELNRVLRGMIGKQNQIPPMYSAVKVNGKRLYQQARNGIEVERPSREIEIFDIRLVRYSGNRAVFDVDCSKGTYIRTLCQDIGDALCQPLCMSFLMRTASAGLLLADSLTLEQIAALHADGKLREVLIGTDALLHGYGMVRLNAQQSSLYHNGVAIRVENSSVLPAGDERENGEEFMGREAVFQNDEVVGGAEPQSDLLVRVYDQVGFVGMGRLEEAGGGYLLKVKKFLSERSTYAGT